MVLKFDLTYIHIFESGETSLTTERTYVSFWVVSVKPVIVSCVSDAVLQSLELNVTHMRCYYTYANRKSESHITRTTTKKQKTKDCYA
jgi:hypothetical protein